MDKHTIITPIGTSIFTNYLKVKRDSSPYKKISSLFRLLNSKRRGEYNSFSREIEEFKSILRQELLSLSRDYLSLSAEVSSLAKIKENLKEEGEIYAHFIATDTLISVIAGEVLKDFFDCFFDRLNITPIFDKSRDYVPGLQVEDLTKFEIGIMNLFEKLEEIKQRSEKISINITGGYKGIIPYLTLWAQINRVSTYYIFEKVTQVQEVPLIPLEFDYLLIEDNYDVLKTLKTGKRLNRHSFDVKFGKDTYELLRNANLISVKDGFIYVSPLGEIMKGRYETLIRRSKDHNRSILSQNIEYKVFEYFLKEINKKYYMTNIGCGVKIKEHEYDFLIETPEEAIIGEVKPADTNYLGRKKGGIRTKFKKSFEFLRKRYKEDEGKNNKKVFVKLILYSFNEDKYKNLLNTVKNIHNEYVDRYDSIEWYLLKVPKNYSVNPHWKIDESILKKFY